MAQWSFRSLSPPAIPVFPAFLSFRAVQSVWFSSHSSCPVILAILLSSGKIAGVPTPANIPAVVGVPANVASAAAVDPAFADVIVAVGIL